MDVAFKQALGVKRITETKDATPHEKLRFSFSTAPDRENVKDEEKLFRRGSLVCPSPVAFFDSLLIGLMTSRKA